MDTQVVDGVPMRDTPRLQTAADTPFQTAAAVVDGAAVVVDIAPSISHLDPVSVASLGSAGSKDQAVRAVHPLYSRQRRRLVHP